MGFDFAGKAVALKITWIFGQRLFSSFGRGMGSGCVGLVVVMGREINYNEREVNEAAERVFLERGGGWLAGKVLWGFVILGFWRWCLWRLAEAAALWGEWEGQNIRQP